MLLQLASLLSVPVALWFIRPLVIEKPARWRVYILMATYQISFKYRLFCCILQAHLRELVKVTSHFRHFQFLVLFVP